MDLNLATMEDIVEELQDRTGTKFVLVQIRFKGIAVTDGAVSFSCSMNCGDARVLLSRAYHSLDDWE